MRPATGAELQLLCSGNTFVGHKVGYQHTDGTDNVEIGYQAGSLNTRGSRNLFIGSGADATYAGMHNASAIGAGTHVAMSNTLILGSGANVDIGTSAPTSKLEVVTDAPDVSSLRLSQLTASRPSVTATDRFLTVDNKGDVMLSRYRVQVSHGNDWSNNVFAPGCLLGSLSEVATFIATNQHLPGLPLAEGMVSKGMEVTQLNAKLLEKVEESTL